VLMLTRDFTRSRSLSHALTGSRSRAGLVAAVITRKRRTLSYFHRCEKVVESKIQYTALSFFELPGSARAGRTRLPLTTRALLQNPRPSHCRYETARDCRRLKRREQAKSARRKWRGCTLCAQVFHKQGNGEDKRRNVDLKGHFAKILQVSDDLARNCTRSA
jgi:hypothetical protein